LRLLSAETLAPVTPQPSIPPIKDLHFTSLAYSADGRYLAVGSTHTSSNSDWTDTEFGLVWDLRAPDQPPRKVEFHELTGAVVLSPDGRTLYNTLPLAAYDVATGNPKWPSGALYAGGILITRNGDLLAVLNYSEKTASLMLVDARTGRTVRVLSDDADQLRSAAFSADDSQLAVGLDTKEVTLWDVASGTAHLRIKTSERTRTIAFSPDGHTLYTAGDEGLLRVYDLTGQRQYLSRKQTIATRHYLYVLPSDDGTHTAYVWRQGRESWASFTDATTGITTKPTRLRIQLTEDALMPAAWSPDGRRFAIHDQDTIVILDSYTGQTLKVKENLDVNSIAYVNQGKRLITGSSEGIRFLDDGLWPEGQYAWWAADCCTTAAPDGESAVIFEHTADGAGERWRIIRTGEGEIISEGELPISVNNASYSPDGQAIAVIGSTGEIYKIDVQSGTIRRAPTTGHDTEGLFVRFSGDSARIVTGAADGRVSLWDTGTLALLGTIAASESPAPVRVSPSFFGNSDTVIIATYDGRTYRWDTRPNHTISYACAMAGRNLTQSEWTEAFGGRPYETTCP
jgi:WD40 repeat protein